MTQGHLDLGDHAPPFHWATSPVPDHVAVTAQRPLPPLREPEMLPDAPGPGGEPLVGIAHRRVRVLSVYWLSGLGSARPGALLRRAAADALYLAAGSLPDGFGLAVFDAWRPLALQRELHDLAYADPSLPPGFVEVPSSDPSQAPPHLTGGAVDVTLTWRGRPLELGTAFDDFSPLAAADALEGTPGPERELRRLLYWTMRDAGFVVADCEWWHFEHGTRRWAALWGADPVYGATQP